MVTAALHPARRRRIARQMPPAPAHEALLRPLGGGTARQVIATAEAGDFIAKLFADLAAPDWRERLAAMRDRRRGADGVLELGIPSHRAFQIALFEAVCPTPGSPRLDPKKIASQGLVIRRREAARWAGWTMRGQAIDGWRRLALPDADPDPARRAAHPAGNAAVRALAARDRAPEPEETVVPLYLAPPAVCAARGRTILFAVLPVVSSERSDGAPDAIDYARLPAEERREMVEHLSVWLKERPAAPLPRAGERLAAEWDVVDLPQTGDTAQLAAFAVFLQQLMIELDAFGGGAAARALRAELARVRLPLARNARGVVTRDTDAASFLEAAGKILIGREANPRNLAMPLEWPRVDAAQGARLTAAALECLSARHRDFAQPAAKFERLTDRFAVRAFIRLKDHPQCPERIVWSGYSEPFRILPWWDGDGPGTKIALPDMSQLKRVKPNVAFELPPALANLLRKDLKALGKGERQDTGGPQIGWLCSFSIPFITLCAFITLNIFLSLLDIVFRWLLFIKICIPIPKR